MEQASPLAAWGQHKALTVILAVLGLMAGLYLASQLPTIYTAEARVSVGAGDLSSGAIAGFPQASTELASDYARYVNDQSLENTDADGSVTASPIPQSSVIRIEANASSTSDALRLSTEATDQLIATVNAGRNSGRLLKQFNTAAGRWSRALSLQTAAEAELNSLIANPAARPARITAVRQQLASATATAASADLIKNSVGSRYAQAVQAEGAVGLRQIRDAEVVASNRRSSFQRYGLAGLLAGLGASLVLSVLLSRRSARRSARRAAAPDA